MPLSLCRFVILCAARTGSTWLRLMLQEHPDILCHGEVLAPLADQIDGFEPVPELQLGLTGPQLADWRDADPVGFLYEAVLPSGVADAVGAKLNYNQLENELKCVRRKLVSDPELRIIHLKRRNLLARYISGWVVQHTQVHGQGSQQGKSGRILFQEFLFFFGADLIPYQPEAL